MQANVLPGRQRLSLRHIWLVAGLTTEARDYIVSELAPLTMVSHQPSIRFHLRRVQVAISLVLYRVFAVIFSLQVRSQLLVRHATVLSNIAQFLTWKRVRVPRHPRVVATGPN